MLLGTLLFWMYLINTYNSTCTLLNKSTLQSLVYSRAFDIPIYRNARAHLLFNIHVCTCTPTHTHTHLQHEHPKTTRPISRMHIQHHMKGHTYNDRHIQGHSATRHMYSQLTYYTLTHELIGDNIERKGRTSRSRNLYAQLKDTCIFVPNVPT